MIGCRPFTDGEVKKILDIMQGPLALRDRTLFVLGIRTGFRISELLSLRVCDMLNDKGAPRERITVARRFMKGGKKKRGRKEKKPKGIAVSGRTILCHPEAQKAAVAWITEAKLSGEDRLFDMTRQYAWRILRDACETAGIPWPGGTHAMRKTFANRMYEKLNHDIFRTQKAMGHSSIAITEKYLSFNEKDIDKAILGQ